MPRARPRAAKPPYTPAAATNPTTRNEIADGKGGRPFDLLLDGHGRQLLGGEKEVPGDHHRSDGHQQPGHRLGPVAVQRFVDEGADGEGDGGQGDVAGIAGEDVDEAGKPEPEAGEQQEVELDEGQARMRVDTLAVQSNERTGQGEEGDGAPREEPESELPHKRLEGVRARATSGDAAERKGVPTGREVQRRQRQGSENGQTPGHAQHRSRAEQAGAIGTLGGEAGRAGVGGNAGGAEGAGAVGRRRGDRVTGPEAETEQLGRKQGGQRQEGAHQETAGVDAHGQAKESERGVSSPPASIRRPGETAESAQRQRQGGNERRVRGQLPRLHHEERHGAEGEGREHGGAPAQKPSPRPINRHQGAERREGDEEARADFAGAEKTDT